ncbi:hypothetical protein AURDEDRAFT_120972 [Auricularia subglabra TFB-10046 SS5]|nr:hypothetical protein AURDEDRAFT_120972 [Auricularia subglabra TFB-10046 SS5]
MEALEACKEYFDTLRSLFPPTPPVDLPDMELTDRPTKDAIVRIKLAPPDSLGFISAHGNNTLRRMMTIVDHRHPELAEKTRSLSARALDDINERLTASQTARNAVEVEGAIVVHLSNEFCLRVVKRLEETGVRKIQPVRKTTGRESHHSFHILTYTLQTTVERPGEDVSRPPVRNEDDTMDVDPASAVVFPSGSTRDLEQLRQLPDEIVRFFRVPMLTLREYFKEKLDMLCAARPTWTVPAGVRTAWAQEPIPKLRFEVSTFWRPVMDLHIRLHQFFVYITVVVATLLIERGEELDKQQREDLVTGLRNLLEPTEAFDAYKFYPFVVRPEGTDSSEDSLGEPQGPTGSPHDDGNLQGATRIEPSPGNVHVNHERSGTHPPGSDRNSTPPPSLVGQSCEEYHFIADMGDKMVICRQLFRTIFIEMIPALLPDP